MRQHLFRKLAAVAGAIALAATASAQVPMPPKPVVPAIIQPVPPSVGNVPPAATPAQPPAVMQGPAVAPHYVPAPLPIAPTVNYGTPCNAGCAPDCGPTEKKSVFGKVFAKHAIGVGTAMPVGCSCHAAEKTFVFGSCSQFFNPGKTCGDGRGGCGIGKHCPGINYANPYGAPGNNCAGPFTYLNR